MRDVFYFRMGGIPCGVCNFPALWSEIHPNGVVCTFHRDRQRSPCWSSRPVKSSQEIQRGVKKTRRRRSASTSPRLSAVAGRQAA